MTDTPPGMVSSWVDLTSEISTPPRGFATPPRGHFTPPRGPMGVLTPPWCCVRSHPSTPPHPLGSTSSDYLRMLREAQSAESSMRGTPLSSALMSQCSTCRNSGCVSPKSPPPSPNLELNDCQEMDSIYINRVEGPATEEAIKEFLWDWSSRPSNTPPKWPLRNKTDIPVNIEKKARYSRRALASLLLSNLVSLLLGAGLGVWLYRRSAIRGIQILIA